MNLVTGIDEFDSSYQFYYSKVRVLELESSYYVN